MLEIFYIGLGGFLGASCRFLLSKWLEIKWGSIIPNGTMVVNILGSFLLGFLMILFLEKLTGYGNLKVIMTTGFLGAFTTFSTFSFETMMLLEDKSYLLAALNIFGNLFFGLLAVFFGIIVAKFL